MCFASYKQILWDKVGHMWEEFLQNYFLVSTNARYFVLVPYFSAENTLFLKSKTQFRGFTFKMYVKKT